MCVLSPHKFLILKDRLFWFYREIKDYEFFLDQLYHSYNHFNDYSIYAFQLIPELQNEAEHITRHLSTNRKEKARFKQQENFQNNNKVLSEKCTWLGNLENAPTSFTLAIGSQLNGDRKLNKSGVFLVIFFLLLGGMVVPTTPQYSDMAIERSPSVNEAALATQGLVGRQTADSVSPRGKPSPYPDDAGRGVGQDADHGDYCPHPYQAAETSLGD